MQPDAILLHYVGYAYHIRGAPLWLIPFIKAVLRQSPNTRLITMFHELFATGKPWESSYWFSPLQRLVAHELSKLSHLRFASTTHAADWLSSISKPFQPQPVVLPICSTIGEPPEITAYTNRLPIAIVFNGGGPWREVLRANGAKILTLLRSMGIHRIVQMGSIPGPFVSEAGTECEQLGPQPAEVVCKTLSKAAISVVAYPSWLTEKSTLLAACAVNGTPVLIFDKDGAWRLHLSKDRKPSFEAVQKDEVPQQKDLVSSSSANCGWYHAKAHSKWHANAIAKALGL